MSSVANATHPSTEERFDIVDRTTGEPTGETRPRSEVHAQGLYHRAVHIWLLSPHTGELLLQRRATHKDSWPNRWDISCAGHLSAGDTSIDAAVRELEEELGLRFPASRLLFQFTHLEELTSVQNGKTFINNEFNNVYLIVLTAEERAALQPVSLVDGQMGGGKNGTSDISSDTTHLRFTLQPSELSAVRYFTSEAVRAMYAGGDPEMVPLSNWESYSRLFDTVAKMCQL